MKNVRIVVMGVSGCGKSSVGKLLADELRAKFVDADDLHPIANIVKMANGIPLDDEDRAPWLKLVGEELAKNISGTVVACSALKRKYRDQIRAAVPGTWFVHLHGSEDLLERRLDTRQGHFLKKNMLASQLDALELLGFGEEGQSYDISESLLSIVDKAAKDYQSNS